MRVKSDWELMPKGNVKVDCDASRYNIIYSEILFIFIIENANKYFLNGSPNILKNRRKK